MKKNFIILFTLISITAFSQVGINTNQPNSTLEVASSPNNNATIDGITYPKLKGDELKAKDDLYNQKQISTVVYVTEPVTTTSPKTSLVNEIGYYYFDGTLWQKLKSNNGGGSINAINGINLNNSMLKLGGTLMEPTTIGTNNTNTLKLTGLTRSSEDPTIISVDSDGTIRKTDISSQFLTSLSTIAKVTTQSVRNSTNKTVNYNSILKNDDDLILNNVVDGTFTVKKAGYYQVNVYNVISTNENADGQTSGTVQTFIRKNGTNFSAISTNHAERTTYVYHNLIGIEYFDIDDVISVLSTHTRTFRVYTGGTISIVSLGS